MIEKFTLIDREFEGQISEGKEAMSLFKEVCAIAVDCGFYKGIETSEMVVSLAAHPKAEHIAQKTLCGWTLDGVEITRKSWESMFEVKGRYLDAYAACIRVWAVSGFLSIGNT